MPDVSWHASWFQCMLMTPCNAKEMKWWIKIQIDRFSIWIRKDSSFPLCILCFLEKKLRIFEKFRRSKAKIQRRERRKLKGQTKNGPNFAPSPVPCFRKQNPQKMLIWSCFFHGSLSSLVSFRLYCTLFVLFLVFPQLLFVQGFWKHVRSLEPHCTLAMWQCPWLWHVIIMHNNAYRRILRIFCQRIEYKILES